MQDPFSLIRGAAGDRMVSFVFPSEIASDRAMRLALKEVPAVEKSRFLSWDRFKERFLSPKESERRPVSRLDLLFFCSACAVENSRKPFLTSIIRSEFAAQSRSMLPVLEQAMNSLFLLEPEFSELGSASFHQDLTALKVRFESFKEEQGLFETEIPESVTINTPEQYKIFFSELILDFEEYRHLTENQPSVELIDSGEPADFRLDFYASDREEVKALLERATEALKQRKEVMITAAEPALLPLLSYYSRLYGVELDIRRGLKLGETPEASLFRLMQEALQSDFQYESMRSFLLNQSPPWGTESAFFNRMLLTCAAEGFTLCGKSSWTSAIFRSGAYSKAEKEGAKLYFRRLCGAMENLVRAGDFSALKSAIQTFLSQYLNGPGLTGSGRSRFESMLQKLNELEQRAELLGELDYGSPFSLWMHTLSRSQYVDKSRSEGIPVYDYRVSAGCSPDLHLVCGLNQSSTSVVVEQAPLLSEPDRELWKSSRLSSGQKAELSRDYTLAFLMNYPISGAEVHLSGAMEALGEPRVAPSDYLIMERVDECSRPIADPLVLERASLVSDGTIASLPSDLHAGAGKYFSRKAFGRGADLTKIPVEEPELLAALRGLYEVEGQLRFSSSMMESFRKCPWRSLSRRLLGDRTGKEAEVVTPAFEGELAHDLLEQFYGSLKERGLPLLPEHQEEAQALFESEAQAFFSSFEEKGRALPVDPEWQALKERFFHQTQSVFRDDFTKFPGSRVMGCEQEFHYEGDGFLLYGRVDRISRSGGRIYLIDYKRSTVPSLKSMMPGENLELFEHALDGLDPENGEEADELVRRMEQEWETLFPGSFQMALYAQMVEQGSDLLSGGEGESFELYYYSLKERKMVSVLEPGNRHSRLKSEAVLIRLKKMALLFARFCRDRINKGTYMIGREPKCEFCDFKNFCREHYSASAMEVNRESE